MRDLAGSHFQTIDLNYNLFVSTLKPKMTEYEPRRWYDCQQDASLCISRLGLMPEPIQTAVCTPLLKQLDDMVLQVDIKSLPREIRNDLVMKIWRSKRRLRNYDANEAMYQTVNQLFLVQKHHQTFMISVLNTLIDVVADYLRNCQLKKIELDDNHLKTLIQKSYDEMNQIPRLSQQVDLDYKASKRLDIDEMKIRPDRDI